MMAPEYTPYYDQSLAHLVSASGPELAFYAFGLARQLPPDPAEVAAGAREREGQQASARTAGTLAVGETTELTAAREALASEQAENARLREELAREHHLATTDAKTGLINRATWEGRLAARIEEAERDGHGVAILYADADGFKRLNDTHGHDEGDKIIAVMGQIFSRIRRSDANRYPDVAARVYTPVDGSEESETDSSRWGGDEYSSIIRTVKNLPLPEHADKRNRHGLLSEQGQVDAVASRIQREFDDFVKGYDKATPGLGITVGYAIWRPGMTAEELVKEADTHMQRTKDAKKAQQLKELPLRRRVAIALGKKLVQWGTGVRPDSRM